MIYKQPTIYKIGNGGNGEAVYNSILEYSDDWKNITEDFSLVDGSLVYIDNNQQGNVSDLNIKFSKKLGTIYFDCAKAWLIANHTLTVGIWNRFLIYNGNEFETVLNGGTNPSPNSFSLPYDVNRGMTLMNLTTSTFTTSDFGVIGYVGTTSLDSGIAVKRISNFQSPTGVVIDKCVFSVIPK